MVSGVLENALVLLHVSDKKPSADSACVVDTAAVPVYPQ